MTPAPAPENASPRPATAVVIDRPGGHDRLNLQPVHCPPPAAGEVRIAVRAIGVNYADVLVRMGLYASARHYVGWPVTPGFEVAGFIEDIGSGVVGWRPGDRVLAVTRFGGYASRIVVPAQQVFRVPNGWLLEQAAAFPTAHLTAWWALRRLAHVQPGENVLVHSAAGGVGQALCRLARLAGAHVTGIVGHPDKIPAARDAGAQHVISRHHPRPWEQALRHRPDGYHVVLDANGADTLRESWHLLAAPGRLVVYGFHAMLPRGASRPSLLKLAWDWLRTPRFNPLDMTRHNRSVLAFNLSFLFDQNDALQQAMSELLDLAAGHALPPPAHQTLPFHDVHRAHARLESGRSTGKIVLHISDDDAAAHVP
ncbi:MAG: zinc-binding dehydrogenase [Deltaproteobacteria bacterium]|nr:MAG: zinc-binding dehydrogenase [Deltaproteobacteria bacterium]